MTAKEALNEITEELNNNWGNKYKSWWNVRLNAIRTQQETKDNTHSQLVQDVKRYFELDKKLFRDEVLFDEEATEYETLYDTLYESRQGRMTIHERIIELGFKQQWETDGHTRYKKRNVEISVQELSGTNIYIEVYKRGYSIELKKHDIKDVESAIKLIKKFIKKEVGR